MGIFQLPNVLLTHHLRLCIRDLKLHQTFTFISGLGKNAGQGGTAGPIG